MEIKLDLAAKAGHREAVVYEGTLSDIAPIFNLIQDCSQGGFFNNIYLTPPYQTGLALQLLSVWLCGKIRLPSGTRHKATLRVIRHGGALAGFILTRHLVPSGASQERYMCAVKSQYRRQGLGRRMIQSVLDRLESNSIIDAECLPNAVHMKRLLRLVGFKSINQIKATIFRNTAERFRISYSLRQDTIAPDRKSELTC